MPQEVCPSAGRTLTQTTFQRLQELQDDMVKNWGNTARAAFLGYTTAAGQGVIAVSVYMVNDPIWKGVPRVQRNKILEMYSLEQEIEKDRKVKQGQEVEKELETETSQVVENGWEVF